MGEKYVTDLNDTFNNGVRAWEKLYENKLDLNKKYAVLEHENTDYKAALDELEHENMGYRVALGELMHQVDQVTNVHENLVQMYQVQARVLDNAMKKCEEYKVKLDKQRNASNGVTLALEKNYIGVPKVPHRPQTPPRFIKFPEFEDPDWVPEIHTPRHRLKQLKTDAFQVVGNGKPGPLTERQAALYAALHQHDQ